MSTLTTKDRRVPILIRRMRTPNPKPGMWATQAQRAQIREILHAPRPQAKLTVGEPDDSYEQEADRVADKVMSMPEPSAQGTAETAQRLEDTELRRSCSECDGELRRQVSEVPGEEEEDEIGQAKASPGARPEVQGATESAIRSLRGGGEPLPPAQREFFESRFGHGFGGVRVHANAQAADVARVVNARAFTLGSDLVFGSGQYAPDTEAGRRLLAHELTHVVQQRGSKPR